MRALLLVMLLAPSLAWGQMMGWIGEVPATGGGYGPDQSFSFSWATFVSGNPGAGTFGTTWHPTANGQVTGIRIQAPTEATARSYTLGLYEVTGGTLLASTTGNIASGDGGWKDFLFSSPVAVTSGTNYVAVYYSTGFNIGRTTGAFPGGAGSEGDLTTSDNAGAYVLGGSMAYPSNAATTLYWASPIFQVAL